MLFDETQIFLDAVKDGVPVRYKLDALISLDGDTFLVSQKFTQLGASNVTPGQVLENIKEAAEKYAPNRWFVADVPSRPVDLTAGTQLNGELILEFPPQALAEISDAAYATRLSRFCQQAEASGVTLVQTVPGLAPGFASPAGWIELCP